MRGLLLLLVIGSAWAQEAQKHTPIISLVEFGEPIYPRIGEQARVEGTVRLKFRLKGGTRGEGVEAEPGGLLLRNHATEVSKGFKFQCEGCRTEQIYLEEFAIEYRLADSSMFEGTKLVDPRRLAILGKHPVCDHCAAPSDIRGSYTSLQLDRRNPRGVGVSSYVIPEFPLIARIAGVNSDVWLKLEVNAEGSPQNITVLNGHPLVIDGALNAAKRWRLVCTNCDWREPFVHYLTLAFRVDDRLRPEDVRFLFDFPNYFEVRVGRPKVPATIQYQQRTD